MKVACLTHYYIQENRAGGEMMLHALLAALVKAGHEVTAYITDTVRLNDTVNGVNIVYGVRPDVVLETVDCDVVVTQFQNGTFAASYAASKSKPLIYIAHNDTWNTSKLIRLLTKRDLVVYNTEWIKEALPTPSQSVVVHPPVDRKAMKTKTTGEYVTLVNLTAPKGVDVFFDLAKRMPDVEFLGVRGGYWKDQQQDTAMPNVTIINNTPNMKADVYAKSRVVLMPSTYETFGMVAAEAIASGIPVIATPTAGLKENLGDAGIYARRGSDDLDRWHAALHKLLTDKKYYAEVSRKALARSKVIDTQKELAGFVAAVEALVDGKH